jgi:biopolymer transport protein ExbD
VEIARAPRRSQMVNLTPLIDVVFLLIVFFMLSTSFVVSESLELRIPSASNASGAVTPDDSWVLRVDGQGAVMDGDKTLSRSALRREVQRMQRQTPERAILVLASDATSVQQLVQVLDVIALAGGRKVLIDKEVAQ